MNESGDLVREGPPDRLRAADVELRAISESDWAVEVGLSDDPEVVRWTYYPPGMDEQAARERIRGVERRAAEGAMRRYVILDERGEPLGTCGIGKLQEETPEVFYALLPRGRRRGAATQAVEALVRWAFASGRAVVALATLDGNGPSERVALRAGFVPVETFEGDHRGRRASLTRWLRRRDAP